MLSSLLFGIFYLISISIVFFHLSKVSLHEFIYITKKVLYAMKNVVEKSKKIAHNSLCTLYRNDRLY